MHGQAIQCYSAATTTITKASTMQLLQQQQQKQQTFNICVRRKSRKKCDKYQNGNNNNSCNNNNLNYYNLFMRIATAITRTTQTRRTAGTDKCNYKNFNKINKLLITTILLITLTTTVPICQTEAAAVAAAASAIRTGAHASVSAMQISPLTLSNAKAAAAMPITKTSTLTASSSTLARTLLSSPTQQQQQNERQLQQQQLFALLSKNRQGNTLTTTSASATATSGTNEKFISNHFVNIDVDNNNNNNSADNDNDSNDNAIISPLARAAAADMAAAASSLEITGFVADDGQQYEKAEKALAAATAANRSNNNQQNYNINSNANNCPKECKCLNDFFDCGKQHLDRVPQLPSYVQMLDLVANKLNDTAVLQIRNLSELHRLSLKRNQLENIPKFLGLVALKQLNLANNRIQRISSEALLALPKLKALDLTKNYLHILENNYFPTNNRLAHLILNSNEISHIDENAFEPLSNLLDLELNNNRLSSLPAGVFKTLNKLRKLSLNYNNLEINWSTFKGLHALQKLFLKANNIRALQDGVFHVMRAIETIELDENGITSLSRQGLFNLTKLHHLSLSNNSISRIELDTWEFTQSLISLDLSHNNISEFKPQHLDCLQRLRHLNLGHNKIQYLVDSTFDCVKNLEDLNLRRNKLAWIIEDQGATPPFKALRKLKKLDLYGNNLKQINSKSLNGLNSLELLNLGGNALATIQTGAFDHMQHLQKVIFKSLNFICDCDLLWFRRWLLKIAQTNAQLHENAICGYPDHLLDRELLTLTPAELICADTPKPVITQEPSNQLTVKGANITMECIAISPAAASLAAADELKIKWRHDNLNIREHERASLTYHAATAGYSTTETQIHHDQTTNQTTIIGYLHLYNVSYESAGKYQCVVANAFGTTYSQKFKISIGIHPSFLQIPSNLTIDSGDSARLVCSATGDPMPEIALQKFGASDFPAATERRLQVIREENAFVITNAKPIDTGIYTCTAESAAGEVKINASLIVNDKPQPNIPIVNKETVHGEATVLECLSDLTADLNQPYHRDWYKDNKPFHTSSISATDHYYFTAEKELLVIVNTQSADAGHYRCEITDNAKTFAMPIELIVVKADFSVKDKIIGILLVTVACVVIGSLIVWCILCYQKRKLYVSNMGSGAGVNGRGSSVAIASGARVAAASSQHMLSGSRGSALDQTQLTTLNRTYLTPQQHQRPRSLADLELNLNGVAATAAAAEQRNRLIVTTTPDYQHLLQRNGAAVSGRAGSCGIGMAERMDDSLTLEYLRHNSTHDAEHNQDHLSSKDSGTGSDAAVKRSIEDFTLTLLPPTAAAAEAATTLPHNLNNKRYNCARASLAKSDAYLDDDDDDDDDIAHVDDVDNVMEYAPAHALGISVYDMELCELNARGEKRTKAATSSASSSNASSPSAERERFLQNNNNHHHHHNQHHPERLHNNTAQHQRFSNDVVNNATLNKTSTNPNANSAATTATTTTQAVDI